MPPGRSQLSYQKGDSKRCAGRERERRGREAAIYRPRARIFTLLRGEGGDHEGELEEGEKKRRRSSLSPKGSRERGPAWQGKKREEKEPGFPFSHWPPARKGEGEEPREKASKREEWGGKEERRRALPTVDVASGKRGGLESVPDVGRTEEGKGKGGSLSTLHLLFLLPHRGKPKEKRRGGSAYSTNPGKERGGEALAGEEEGKRGSLSI